MCQKGAWTALGVLSIIWQVAFHSTICSTTMLRRLHDISVLLTVAMLLTQAVCPSLGFACGCSVTGESFVTQATCCCCSQAASMPSECSHCASPSEQNVPADDSRHDSACYCGDSAPIEPIAPAAPESSETTLKTLSLIACINVCKNEAVVLSQTTPARPSVLSSEELTHNYRQVVLCVWLT